MKVPFKRLEESKAVTHYVMAPVPIEVRPLTPEEGGGYLATIPPWGATFIADGETEQEAIDSLKRLCEVLADNFLNKNERPRYRTMNTYQVYDITSSYERGMGRGLNPNRINNEESGFDKGTPEHLAYEIGLKEGISRRT